MSLQNWASERLIEQHDLTEEDMQALLKVADTEIKDFQVSILSKNTRYALAFQVALRLAMIALYKAGYRIIDRNKHHFLAITSLEFTIGAGKEEVRYFDKARQKRHGGVYSTGDEITEKELTELMERVVRLRDQVGTLLNS